MGCAIILAFYFNFYNNLFNNKTQISMKQVVFSLLIVMFSVSMTYAKSRVTGKVTDVAGEALIGASVTLKEKVPLLT